jgi:D-3-phosphoglycerate dehydrogenase / 2-oxoglutarate reductase
MAAAGSRVVLVYPLAHPAGEQTLRDAGCEVRVLDGDDEPSLVEGLAGADAVIVRGPAKITARVIDGAPRLRAIAGLGAGTDNIDVEAATRRGIPVLHNAGIAPQAVAEFAIGAAIAAHRRLLTAHTVTAGGDADWNGRFTTLIGTEMTGTTFGVIGLGNIGREVARMAGCMFDATVLGYDPLVGAENAPPGVELVDDLHDLLRRSSTVSIHCALTPQTRGLIGREELRMIGPEGVLVDSARGGIVDQEALIEALTAGELRGAVLDVFEPEPPGPELVRRLAATPNLVLTPHIAGITTRSQERLARAVAESVVSVLDGVPPARVVNPAVLAASHPTPAGD